MALPTRSNVTLGEFKAFVNRLENADKRFEFIDGDIIEVPSNPYASVLASRIITFLTMYLMQNQSTGHVTGEGGGIIIDGHVFAPDVAYIHALPTQDGYETTPPLLAVEVISNPHNNAEQTDLRRKIAHYMRSQVLVWVVDHVARQVEVHTPGKSVRLLNETDTLTADEMLPGFTLSVSDIFPAESE